jgi:hypothetical protein
MTKWFTIIDLNARNQGPGRVRRQDATVGATSHPSERPSFRDPRSMRARMDAYLRGDPTVLYSR